jgi:hypothetical protein
MCGCADVRVPGVCECVRKCVCVRECAFIYVVCLLRNVSKSTPKAYPCAASTAVASLDGRLAGLHRTLRLPLRTRHPRH